LHWGLLEIFVFFFPDCSKELPDSFVRIFRISSVLKTGCFIGAEENICLLPSRIDQLKLVLFFFVFIRKKWLRIKVYLNLVVIAVVVVLAAVIVAAVVIFL